MYSRHMFQGFCLIILKVFFSINKQYTIVNNLLTPAHKFSK
jgi:hypothetical protein